MIILILRFEVRVLFQIGQAAEREPEGRSLDLGDPVRKNSR